MIQSFAISKHSIRSIFLGLFLLSALQIKADNPKATKSETTKVEIIEQAQKLVRGYVVDEFGEPMVGVEVRALGSHKMAITNTEGKYSVLANDGDVLRFSQFGAATKDEKTTSSRILNVELSME